MIYDVIKAIERFEKIRKEQAESQSDRSPWLPVAGGSNAAVTPVGSPANTIPFNDGTGCSCETICPGCVDHQMMLNQAI